MRGAPLGMAGLLGVASVLGLLACSGAKPLPKGPPPEYEEPPAPSWYNDGAAPTSASDAGAMKGEPGT